MHNRKKIRLSNFNYSTSGAYFITICTNFVSHFDVGNCHGNSLRNCCNVSPNVMKRHAPHYFGEIENGAVILNECGEVAARFWQEIPNHFGYARLDEWIVMPNHVHGIIWIENNTVGNCHGNSLQNIKPRRFQLIPIIINHFKSAVTREIRRQNLDVNFAWQKSFYDRIIRDDDELNRIREYIIQNPVKW